jgi:predicted nucleic acid-binding protein
VRVYYDTGVFIDYLSVRGNTILRTAGRRGRTPARIAADAKRLFEVVRRAHVGATSCLTYYELEEALYKQLAQSAKGIPRANTLLVPLARDFTAQVQIIVDLFEISVLDLSSTAVRAQLQNPELRSRGVRAADALHAETAIAFDADLIVSTDKELLQLDAVLSNPRGGKILCRDTDAALRIT